MPEALTDNLDYLIGGLVILFFAYSRFNTPVSSRSSTTAFRYHTSALTYALLTLAVWLMVTRLGLRLIPDLEGLKVEDPILGALLITGLLPHTPGLAKVDGWLRAKLHALAAIPHEVRSLAAKLVGCEPDFPEDLRADTRARLLAAGFDERDVVFEANGTPEALWTALAAITVRLRSWRSDARRGACLAGLEEWARLERGYEALVPKARAFFGSMRELSREPADERFNALGREYQTVFLDQTGDLYRLACKAVSRVALGCHPTHRARQQELRSAGFHIESGTVFSLDQVVAVFLLVFFVMAPVLAFARSQFDTGVDLPEALALSLMIASIYSSAVVCSVFPRERWQRWAKRRPGSTRPWRFYALAGVMAAGAGAVFSFLTRLVLLGDLAEAWQQTLVKSPVLLMAFVTAFVLAFLSDDEPDEEGSEARWRVLEGGVAALALMAAAALVYMALHEIAVDDVPPLAMLLSLSGAIGFFLGAFVPTWYRHPEADEMGAVGLPVPAVP